RIAPQCDLVIVVGSRNSSNSVRLVEVARQAGAARAERVDQADDIAADWLEGAASVGVTSGASVPDHLVHQVVDWLRRRGFDQVVTESLVEETLTFALPPDLRRDLRAASRAGG
ncbi:MAG: 4-hydroxy-3-methylbut-2-enyl diphosphate reductase, partial [Propionibacteriaceae bacterium]|nr:4-hydroxy-3-methylbut-2-enyl diphosphate reductase [Propionibacteriaceae bacterium]